VDLVIHPPHLI